MTRDRGQQDERALGERAVEETPPDAESGREEESAGAGRSGWSSQPRVLKILLLVSVLAVVAGVVRCAVELTQPRADIGGTEHVGPESP